MRFVIEKPDSVTCIGFEGKLQNFESWRDLRPVECHPFQLESNGRKIINTQLSFKKSLNLKNPIQTRGLMEKYVSHFIGSWCFHGNRIFTGMALRWPLFGNKNLLSRHMKSSLHVMDLNDCQGRNRFPLLRSGSCHVWCLKTSFMLYQSCSLLFVFTFLSLFGWLVSCSSYDDNVYRMLSLAVSRFSIVYFRTVGLFRSDTLRFQTMLLVMRSNVYASLVQTYYFLDTNGGRLPPWAPKQVPRQPVFRGASGFRVQNLI